MRRPDGGMLADLRARFGSASAQDVLAGALDRFGGRIALVSSFGAEAAVLLHMVARLDRNVPVLMLDTLLLFPETRSYQQALSAHLGLTDVRRLTPDEHTDPDRTLHQSDSVACCALRKIAPLEAALHPFDGVITGRKRFQTGHRAQMERFELEAGRIKVNPLADWTPAQTATYFDTYDLPRHPLVSRGYPSIGCAPCTSPVAMGEDTRAGRWRGEDREECGIHFGAGGIIERTAS